MNLNDGRNVFYVTYIYTSEQFRNKGIASKLLEKVDEIVGKNNLDGVLLTTDIEDNITYEFYLKKGFMPDIVLRTYDKFDVLFK